MNSLAIVAIGLTLWPSVTPAQTNDFRASTTAESAADTKNGVIGGTSNAVRPEFAPLTASERLRLYFTSAFGPGAIATAAAAGGISQWRGTPKEWREGAEAYGDRLGNAFAIHVIRTTLQSGVAAVLHEDNRYIRSTGTGFWKRSRHAVASVFLARNDAGAAHFAYSRFGAAAGASFISRIWQPYSTNASGDAAVNFGVSIAADIGWNAFKEFRPHRSPRY